MTEEKVASIIETEKTINKRGTEAVQLKIKIQSQTDEGTYKQYQKIIELLQGALE